MHDVAVKDRKAAAASVALLPIQSSSTTNRSGRVMGVQPGLLNRALGLTVRPSDLNGPSHFMYDGPASEKNKMSG